MSKGDRAPLVGFFVVASVRIVDKYEIKKNPMIEQYSIYRFLYFNINPSRRESIYPQPAPSPNQYNFSTFLHHAFSLFAIFSPTSAGC